ncbi:hypothetical protein LINGRAHAP2_LOCUS34612 [Linum grandiflorum]
MTVGRLHLRCLVMLQNLLSKLLPMIYAKYTPLTGHNYRRKFTVCAGSN